jgi:signal peptidase I
MGKSNVENSWMELVKTIVLAGLIAIIIRSVFYEPFNIPSGSMKPNLLIGDYLFVSKFEYGYSRYSFPFGLAPIEDRIFGSEPERGDVIVFKLPSNPRDNYIKRVIGLPGDTVQVRNGRLYINNQLIPREEVDTIQIDTGGFATQYLQTLPNGVEFFIWENTDRGRHDNTPRFTVPEGQFFVMGDNRDNSEDSRSKVGFIPYENIVGEASFIFFSTNGYARLFEFWKWPWTVRYDRLLQVIE